MQSDEYLIKYCYKVEENIESFFANNQILTVSQHLDIVTVWH
jgi:hypothetical protein